jgi:FMN phosphatase YigB (HAD superfamily)
MAEHVHLHTKEAVMQIIQNRGVKFALFDADDTKYHTHEIFLQQIGIFEKEASRLLDSDQAERFSTLFRQLNKAALKIEGISVSEERWDWIIGLLGRVYPGLAGAMDEHKHHLEEIYKITPRRIEGIEEVLNTFERSGIELGVLTHASDDWNYDKMTNTGLSKFFHPENIHTVSVYEFKTREDWLRGIRNSGYTPQQTMAVGNSLTSDIIPAHDAGVEMKVWLRDETADSFFAQGEAPSGTIIINQYSHLFSAILGSK